MKYAILLLLVCASFFAGAGERLTREQVVAETLKPYAGPSNPGVDTSTLTNKVMCGYQGWFNAEGDGAERGWTHWSRAKTFDDGNATVDMWPDMTELGPDERFTTGFSFKDGRKAEVFSSYRKETVLRHFKWMREYGIDGVFVQRFIGGLKNPRAARHNNTVLNHCREGANVNGRAYAVMYDLSGLGPNRIQEVIEDWRELKTKMRVTDDPAYLKHRGKPVVSVWGIGFSDDRKYTLAECRTLIEFLKNDKECGGCTVMLGVPTYWRDLHRDAVKDPALHDVIKLADIVSPWTIGRYRNQKDILNYETKTMKADIAWCAENKLDFFPVAFPGFTWRNLKNDASPGIPRLGGQFLWSQFAAFKRSGASMIYVAMFDEVDEGTAIFKCANYVPVGTKSVFLGLDGLPADHYLKLTGNAGKLLRGEIPLSETLP
jgi:hypothetical protein